MTLTDWAANAYRWRWFVKLGSCHFSKACLFVHSMILTLLWATTAIFTTSTICSSSSPKHQFEMTCAAAAADQESIHLWRPLRLSTSTPAQRDGWSQSHGGETCLYPSPVSPVLNMTPAQNFFFSGGPKKVRLRKKERGSGFHFRNPWRLMDRLLSRCRRQITLQDVINAYPRCQMDHKMTKCTY